MSEFLHDFDPRPWRNAPDWLPDYLQLAEFYLPEGDGASSDISVRVVDADRRPKRADVERLWQSLSQAYALILVVRYEANGSQVADLAGGRQFRAGDTGRPRPIITQKVPIADAANLCRVVLAETNANAANRLIARWMDDRASDLKGMKNDGLFARHALLNVVPERDDWEEHSARALPLRAMTGRDLVKSLGFQLDEASEPSAALLVVDSVPQATAIFLDGDGTFDTPSAQFGAESPVSHAMAIARKHRVNWVVLTRGKGIRLHPVSPDVGVGRRGRSTTYVEINLGMLPEEQIGFLWSLFSADALREGGYLDEILAASERFATDLGTRLRDRVYNEVVPVLATALGRDLQGSDDENWLDEAYHRTMVALFRLLFIAYAEDMGLLPYERNVPYTNASLKKTATGLVEYVNGEREFDEESTVLWRSVQNLWRAVDKGKPDWGIPHYNGGLFSSSSGTGAALDGLELSDAEFGKALARLLVDVDPDGVVGPVDFRSLSVREFGTIYEGLLESELSVATTDLLLDRNGSFVPAESGCQDIEVQCGDVYFHNESGERKATGSYFTPSAVVEHILDQSLEPAITDHLGRVQDCLERGDDAEAGRMFFDFRCADIAMGSGHFLVAAVDRIEGRFSEFLSLNPIPSVSRDLEALRKSALTELRTCADDALITDEALLRRQVARRCIYGVDLNSISVELARLAIWIHTFVPGLPLSFLDHNLVVGNSLTGIGTIVEAEDALGQELGSANLRGMIDQAQPALERLGTVSDATVKDVQVAREAHEEAMRATEPVRRLLDVVVLSRSRVAGFELLVADEETVSSILSTEQVVDMLSEMKPLHFPVAFPEVFLRERAGFDVLVGNPPFVNRLKRQFSGLPLDKAVVQSLYPSLVGAYTDQSSLFMLRNADLLAVNGYLAVVQPESFLATRDSNGIRTHLLHSGLTLSHVWVATRSVFEGASVRTCVPTLQLAAGHSAEVSRSVDVPVRLIDPCEIEQAELAASKTWSVLISDIYGAPRAKARTSGKLAEIASCTADFRDQYYGLVDRVYDREPSKTHARLITTGLIDPFHCMWGEKVTRFNKVRYSNPVVAIDELAPSLVEWAASRLRPKVLLATQGKILEAIVDPDGDLLPCVPVISVIPASPDDLWLVAALFAAPSVSAGAAEASMGAGLGSGSIKLSATQTADLPLPADRELWSEAARKLCEHTNAGTLDKEVLGGIAKDMDLAFGVTDPAIFDWWFEKV